MGGNLGVIVRIGILLLAAGGLFASDIFVGTWRGNPVKTKLSHGSPEVRRSEMMSIDDMGLDQYRVPRKTSDGKNSSVGLTFHGRERSDDGTTVVGVKVGPLHFRNTIKG